MTKKITALRLPTAHDQYVPVSIKDLGQYDPSRDVFGTARVPLAIFMPQSMVELVVIDRAASIRDFVPNSEEEIEAGYIGHYRGWPCVTDVLGFGPKLNFLTPQLVPLLNNERLAPRYAGVCLLPETLGRYREVNNLQTLSSINPNEVLLISTRESFLVLIGQDWFDSKFVPTSSAKLRAAGYVGNFDGMDVVAPNVHDSVFVPLDLEEGIYVVELDDLPRGEKLQADHDGSGIFADDQVGPDDLARALTEGTVVPVEDEAETPTKYPRPNIPLYDHLYELPVESFRRLDVSTFVDLNSAPRIADDEMYYASHSMWGHFTGSVLPATDGKHAESLEITESHVEALAGYVGLLHGRHLVTDSFAAPPAEFSNPRRADLDGLYAVKIDLIKGSAGA